MPAVCFDCEPQHVVTLGKILDRASKLFARAGVEFRRQDVSMDLLACHANGCPLDFQRLLDAPELDFTHDVCGIIENINRHTGRLMNHFAPRCAA